MTTDPAKCALDVAHEVFATELREGAAILTVDETGVIDVVPRDSAACPVKLRADHDQIDVWLTAAKNLHEIWRAPREDELRDVLSAVRDGRYREESARERDRWALRMIFDCGGAPLVTTHHANRAEPQARKFAPYRR
jgi:hypothetical protein